MDVIEDLADELWIGDICNYAKLAAAEGAEGDIDFKDSPQWSVTRRCAQVLWAEQDVCGAVTERLLELVHHLTGDIG